MICRMVKYIQKTFGGDEAGINGFFYRMRINLTKTGGTGFNKSAACYLIYTGLFLLLFWLCFGVYLYGYGKSVLWYYDGLEQHYISFVYLGKWGRSIVKNLVQNHEFCIPLWDLAIGYGADIPTTLTAYLWDPFNWISFFVPSAYAEAGYTVMIVLKFYFCGFAFCFLARKRKQPVYAALCGAIVYTFSASLYIGFYQSFFINPMIIFPLLVYGIDRLYDENRPGFYVVILAVSFFSYFYFAYMMCILTAVYCIFRILFGGREEKTFSAVVKMIGRFLLYSVIAAGIAAVCLLPVLKVLLGSERMGLPHYLPSVFDKTYYASLFKGWITSYNMLSRDCIVGWGALALVCVIVLFMQRGKYSRMKTEFIAGTAALCIPAAGSLMNGMSYTANRWVWAYSLLVSLMVTAAVTEMKNLSVRQAFSAVAVVALYIALAYGVFDASGENFRAAAVLAIAIAFCCFLFPKFSEMPYRIIICGLAGLSVMCTAYYTCSYRHGNNFGDHTDTGQAYSMVTNSGGLPLLNNIDQSDETRFDQYGLGLINNAVWLTDRSGMSFYDSIYNENINQFHNELAVNTGNACSFCYSGLNRRSELEALMGVNHYFTDADNEGKPVGFEEPEAQMKDIYGRNLESFKAEQENSLFYTFRNTMSYDEFNQLTPLEKQDALMQVCVTDDGTGDTDAKDIETSAETVDFTVNPLSGVSYQDGCFTVSRDGAQAELCFDEQTGAELYLYCKGVDYENGKAEKFSFSVQGYDGSECKDGLYDVLAGLTWYSHMYGGKTDWLLNMGQIPGKADRIVITFNNAGTYTFNQLELYVKDTEKTEENISRLERTEENVSADGNRVSCDVTLDQPETLFTSIPYSEGWTAYDNGREIEIEKADIAFMSMNLEAGEHHIELVYRTPGLFAGLAVSAVSVVAFIMIGKRRKKMVQAGRK